MTCTVDETAIRRWTYRRGMRAEDIAEDAPVVRVDSQAVDAARLLAEHRLTGLLVTDTSGKPYAVLPAFELLRFILPRYVQDDLALAGVMGDSGADLATQNLAGKTVGDVLPEYLRNIPSAKARDSVIKVAAQMAQLRSPLIAVTKDGKLHGVITASRLLAAALGS
jgi:CBS domain-containing protein